MDKNKAGNTSLREIREWKQIKRTSAALYAGACTAQGWKPGKRVTEQDYDSAITAFGGTAMDARARKSGKAGKEGAVC